MAFSRSKSRHFLGISRVSLALIGADMAAVIFACILAVAVRFVLPGQMPLGVYGELIAVQTVLFPCLFAIMGLYPGTLLHPAEELKRLFIAIAIGFLLVSAFFFLLKSADAYSRLFFLLAWVATFISVPLARNTLRLACWRKKWWQTGVIVVAEQDALAYLNAEAGRARFMGFYDAAYLVPGTRPATGAKQPFATTGAITADTAESSSHTEQTNGASAFGNSQAEVHPLYFDAFLEEQVEPLARRFPEAVVVIHLPSVPKEDRATVIDVLGLWFRSVLILPGQDWIPCRPAEIVHMGPSFGFTLRRNLADARRIRLKRMLDLCLTTLCCIAGIPLFLGLAACIWFDSKGPVLFRQRRIGKDGKAFFVFKFRTMQVDAQEALAAHLANDPVAAAEWEATQKLKDDPRITRVGRFLRKTSLDELPQIINVLRGEMSLVGPRPIVAGEVDKYGEGYPAYARCLPGITGLWQISGRSDTSYEERVALDAYYMNNWSVWLDIYIVIRTIPVVLGKQGAY